MHVEPHPRGQHPYGGADGHDGRHGQRRAHRLDRLPHALRQGRQRLEVEQVVLRGGLVDGLRQGRVGGPLLPEGGQHLLQPPGQLRALLGQGRVDTLHLLRLGETGVAGDRPGQHVAVEAADVAQVDGQLEGQHVAVRLDRLPPVVEQLPPFPHDRGVGQAQVAVGLRGRCRGRVGLGGRRRGQGRGRGRGYGRVGRGYGRAGPWGLLVVEKLVGEEEQPVAGRREKHPRDVFRPLVVGHAQQLGRPAQVLLLRQPGAAAEDHVIALRGRTLQHQQTQLVLPAEDPLRHVGHLPYVVGVGGVEVDVHPHRAAHAGRAPQRAVGVRQARVVHLRHALLVGASVALRVAQRAIVLRSLDGAHHLRPAGVVNKITRHKTNIPIFFVVVSK